MSFTVGGVDYERQTISFESAIDKVLDERRERQDFNIKLRDFSLSLDADGENIVGTIDGGDYVPTMHCLKQMATWMGVSHAFLRQYMNPVLHQNGEVRYERDQVDREILVKVFKNGIRDGRVDPNKEFTFRTYNDGTLRAMLSDRYAIIDNVWYLEYLRDVLGGDARFMHWRGNADTLYGNLLLPDTIKQESDSEYGGMLSISNCEIGKRRLSITPSIFRGICTNGCIFGQEVADRLSQVHRGSVDLNDLRKRIKDNIDTQIPYITTNISTFLNMKNMKVTGDVTRVIAQVAQDYKLSNGNKGQAAQVATEYANHENSFRNLFGIVNAVTRAAQHYDPAEHVRLDEVGGRLMEFTDGDWDNFQKRAYSMSDKMYNKTFGIVVV